MRLTRALLLAVGASAHGRVALVDPQSLLVSTEGAGIGHVGATIGAGWLFLYFRVCVCVCFRRVIALSTVPWTQMCLLSLVGIAGPISHVGSHSLSRVVRARSLEPSDVSSRFGLWTVFLRSPKKAHEYARPLESFLLEALFQPLAKKSKWEFPAGALALGEWLSRLGAAGGRERRRNRVCCCWNGRYFEPRVRWKGSAAFQTTITRWRIGDWKRGRERESARASLPYSHVSLVRTRKHAVSLGFLHNGHPNETRAAEQMLC